MEYALIKESKVYSIIVADQDFVQSISDQYDLAVEVTDQLVGIDWTFTAEGFIPPVVEKSSVDRVTMRQFKLALLKKGYLAKVQEAISTMQSPVKEEVEIEWQYATSVSKESSLTIAFQEKLELSQEGTDDLFEMASSL